MFLQLQLLAYTQKKFLNFSKKTIMAMLKKTKSYLNAPFLPCGYLLKLDLPPVFKFLGLRD